MNKIKVKSLNCIYFELTIVISLEMYTKQPQKSNMVKIILMLLFATSEQKNLKEAQNLS